MSFIDRLEELRKEKNVSRKQLLEDCGLGKNQITYWEQKHIVPNLSTLTVLSNYFGVTVDYLTGDSDEKTAPAEELEGIDFALSGEIREMSENEKQDLLDYIRFKKSQREKRNDS